MCDECKKEELGRALYDVYRITQSKTMNLAFGGRFPDQSQVQAARNESLEAKRLYQEYHEKRNRAK